MVGGITLDRGRRRNRCVDVGLPVAVQSLRERDAAHKIRLAGWWMVLYWIGEGGKVRGYRSAHCERETLPAKQD